MRHSSSGGEAFGSPLDPPARREAWQWGSAGMPTFLEGMSLAFFRGIGPENQILGPFREFNFFVGQNNSGKSTVLDAIHRYFGSEGKPRFEPVDSYRGEKTGEAFFRIGVSKEVFEQPILDKLREVSPRRHTQLLSIGWKIASAKFAII